MLAVITTATQTLEETEEYLGEALVAEEAMAVKEIAEIILQLPNHYLKENSEKGVYISLLSLKVHIEPHNSRKYLIIYPFYAPTEAISISTM